MTEPHPRLTDIAGAHALTAPPATCHADAAAHGGPPRRTVLRLLGGAAAGVLAPRTWLGWGGLVGAAHAAAATDTQPRLVVVMLRGALDGLAAVPAVGDPAWANLRGGQNYRLEAPGGKSTAPAPGTPLAAAAPLPLNSTFALHPALAELHRWYTQRELLVVHGLASPYRERSHFDAQQMLEAGSDRPFALSTGWLGRALQAQGQPAVALETTLPLGLRGADLASTWSPSRPSHTSEDTLARVARLYQADPALAKAWGLAAGNELNPAMGTGTEPGGPLKTGGNAGDWSALLQQAGLFLTQPNGPRVAWLDTDGWDTHSQQEARLGRLLPRLDQALATLKTALGAAWAHTTVLVMTEFGRTAAPNGSGGSDHGTGAAAFVAGGNVAGGRVLADWPGLGNAQLLGGRDLRPTLDIRGLLATLVERQFGLSATTVRKGIVPGAPAWRDTLWRA